MMSDMANLSKRGWKECKLGDVVVSNAKSITTEYPYKTIQYLDTGSITCGKLDSYQECLLKKAPSRARRLVKENDIVYSSVRPIQRHYGYIVNPPENLVVSTGFSVIETNKEKADPKFIYYFLTSNEIVESLEIIADASTTTYPSLKPSDIEKLDILLPPLPEQRAIAGVLSSLDDKIDLLHHQNKTMESLVKVFFKQLFECDIKKNKLGKLGDLVEVTFGGEWGKEVPDREFIKEVQCIRGTDIADLQTGLATRAPIRFVKEKKFQAIEPKDGDLLIEVSGGTDGQSTGRTIYINSDVKELFNYPPVFSNFCRLFRAKKREYMFYLYCYINMLYDQGDFFNLENGSSGIKNFDYKAFLFELEYDIHNDESIMKFDKEVEPFFKKINKNKSQIKTLTILRDALLPKLMSGEVNVF